MTTDRTENRLLAAVDALTRPRQIPTTIIDDDTGGWLSVHVETHPSLLDMLADGISTQGQSPSSDPGLPIDVEAIDIQRDIRGDLRSWCETLEFHNEYRNLQSAIRRWYTAHVNAYRSGEIGDTADRAVTRAVEGWVHRIETKFDPPEKREWTSHCPGYRKTFDSEGNIISQRRCRARRVEVDGTVRFAIEVNVTKRRAECVSCGTVWDGERDLVQLRYETNLMELEDESTRQRDEKFLRHAVHGDTETVERPESIA